MDTLEACACRIQARLEELRDVHIDTYLVKSDMKLEDLEHLENSLEHLLIDVRQMLVKKECLNDLRREKS